MKIVESLALLDQQKRVKVEALIRRLIDTHIIFVDIDDDVLLDLDNLNTCGDNPMCLIKENGEPQLSIPKKHLIADSLDNERIYLGRIADELVRNERVKIYMFDTKKYLNVKNVNYTIHSDEFIIAQTALTADYFSDLDALKTTEHITNIDYYSAQPSISATYSNEPISLTEQYKRADTNETIEKECVVKEVDIIGNVQSFWKKLFPKRAKEIVFRDTEECTFLPMCHLLSEKYGKIVKPDEVRQYLWSAYTSLINIDPSFEMKIWKILKAQGKSKMMDQVIKKQVSFETLVFSNQYYLSDMDLWVLCASQNLPVILFNTNGLKGFVKKDLEWLKLGGEINDTYYFIRSNAGSFANKVYEYHLIHPQMKLSSLGELNSMVREGYIAGSKYQPNVQTAEEYLKKVVFIGK
jgi:hypothetical protein